jgi:hypothetical protein
MRALLDCGARSFATPDLRNHSWWIALLVGVVLALRSGNLVLAVWPDDAQGGDFAQEYVLARALLDGIDGYQPMGVLTDRYGIPAPPSGQVWAGIQIPLPILHRLVSYFCRLRSSTTPQLRRSGFA